MTRFGFVASTPGTVERGRREHERQVNLIADAGGIVAYMTCGVKNSLTASAGRATMAARKAPADTTSGGA